MNAVKPKLRGFAYRLSRAIYESGLDCVQLGELIGCNRKTIYKWRDGYTEPTAFQIARLCAVLDVNANWLLGLEE